MAMAVKHPTRDFLRDAVPGRGTHFLWRWRARISVPNRPDRVSEGRSETLVDAAHPIGGNGFTASVVAGARSRSPVSCHQGTSGLARQFANNCVDRPPVTARHWGSDFAPKTIALFDSGGPGMR